MDIEGAQGKRYLCVQLISYYYKDAIRNKIILNYHSLSTKHTVTITTIHDSNNAATAATNTKIQIRLLQIKIFAYTAETSNPSKMFNSPQ